MHANRLVQRGFKRDLLLLPLHQLAGAIDAQLTASSKKMSSSLCSERIFVRILEFGQLVAEQRRHAGGDALAHCAHIVPAFQHTDHAPALRHQQYDRQSSQLLHSSECAHSHDGRTHQHASEVTKRGRRNLTKAREHNKTNGRRKLS